MIGAAQVVSRFINAVNARDAESARTLLATGAELVFPGGNTFRDVGGFLEWTKGRYKNATYRYERIEELSADGDVVVYAAGTIDGELNDGSMFSGVRCLDRFQIHDGLISRKEAWSDMADFLRKRAG